MLTIKAPAKINWFLNVLGLRKDGFHEIQSLLQKVSLFDTLTLKPSGVLSLAADMRVPVKENLVFRAGLLLKEKHGVMAGAEMRLVKEIPTGAGLGGGSSDAAAALMGLNELWALGLSPDELCEAGELIGSDVPFFLRGSLSFVEGRGEKITGYSCQKEVSLLLVKPSYQVSTAWVYGQFTFPGAPPVSSDHTGSELTKKPVNVNNIRHFIGNVAEANLPGIARSSGTVLNDLEAVTLKRYPIIGVIKQRLIDRGALFTLMSGSGPTVFGVFSSYQEAEETSHHFHEFWTAPVRTIIEDE